TSPLHHHHLFTSTSLLHHLLQFTNTNPLHHQPRCTSHHHHLITPMHLLLLPTTTRVCCLHILKAYAEELYPLKL
ncbi:hypothetical protein Tsubulata_025924, partial [Turnera subulata]